MLSYFCSNAPQFPTISLRNAEILLDLEANSVVFLPDGIKFFDDKLTCSMKVFHLASDGHPSWPYTVDYAPQHAERPFYFASGDSRNGNGSFLSAREALAPQWRRDLESAGGLWLLPFLERLSNNETIEAKEILDAYESLHGQKPESSEWPD